MNKNIEIQYLKEEKGEKEMKKFSLILVTIFFMSACTQVITAPIKVVGAVAGAAIDVGAAGVRAVAGSDEDDDDK